MSLKKDGERRWVELELLVPGTPEQVWQALATGDGYSSWFTRASIEERVGGAIVFDFGGGAESKGTVTHWEPPLRLEYEERNWSGEAPPLATEIVVTSRSGGKCLVRMVHSLFTRRDDWDDEMEGFEAGWPGYFEILRLYLRGFPGQRAHHVRVSSVVSGSAVEAWHALAGTLALANPNVSEQRSTPSGAPALAGQVERVLQTPEQIELLLRLDRPTPGIASIATYGWQAKTRVALSLYLYGPESRTVAEAVEPEWRAWLASTFPSK
jgi:uncharacterized protein YndB with AHSA1/START domain